MRAELVGRETELATLTECLAAARRGRPQVVLCLGEPGIGKTRLADELLALTSAADVLGVWGRAVDSLSAPPYWPWSQVVRAVANSLDLSTTSERLGIDSELAQLAPDLFSSREMLTVVDGSTDDRFRQFDAMTRLVREVCRQTPTVIVLDDIQWADRPSLLLLQHVARAISHERLLVVVNSREGGQAHGDLVARLGRELVTTTIRLRGLGPPAIRQQLMSVVGEVSDDELASAYSLTGGNPFFVREVGLAMTDARTGRRFVPVTPTVREAIGDRLDRLSGDCVVFIHAAAIVGREFGVDVVSTMVDVSPLRGLDLVEEAERTALVEVTTADFGYRFVHDLVCDAIEARIPATEQVHLHRAAADAIEQRYSHDLGPHIFDLARHWAKAAVLGEAVKAASWIARAGEEAMRRLAYEEGARLFRQALRVGGGDLDDATRFRLLLAAGAASHLSADYGGSLAVCLEAAALGRRLGRPELVAETALVMDVVGHATFDDATRRLCEEVLSLLGPRPSALRARVMARLVETYVFQDLEPVALVSQQALEMAEEIGDRPAMADALRARQLVCSGPDGLDERVDLADRMLALSREARDVHAEMWARLWQIDASLEHGDLSATGEAIGALAVCVQRVRGPVAQFEVLRCRAVQAQGQARFEEARLLELEAFTVLDPTDHDVRFTFRGALLAMVGYHQGQDEESVAANSFASAPEGHADALGLIGGIANAFTLATAGRNDAALSVLRSIGPASSWRPPQHARIPAYAMGVVIAATLGRLDDLVALYDGLKPYGDHHVASGFSAMTYFGPVDLWLGVAAHHLGRLDDAVSHLERADRACAASGAPGFRAEAQYELAAALLKRAGPGDLSRARSLATGAEDAAESLGMDPLTAKTRNLSRCLDEAPDQLILTRREREVAELVAQGLTNRQVAKRLFLSERTAQTHVQNILNKLDLPNRGQVALWVRSQGISRPIT